MPRATRSDPPDGSIDPEPAPSAGTTTVFASSSRSSNEPDRTDLDQGDDVTTPEDLAGYERALTRLLVTCYRDAASLADQHRVSPSDRPHAHLAASDAAAGVLAETTGIRGTRPDMAPATSAAADLRNTGPRPAGRSIAAMA